MRAARARRKYRAAVRAAMSVGMFCCEIQVVAGTHYLVKHPGGQMFKIGKPIKGVK
jgi:hypothetical protein